MGGIKAFTSLGGGGCLEEEKNSQHILVQVETEFCTFF